MVLVLLATCAANARAADLLIDNARLIDGTGGLPREAVSILARDGLTREIAADLTAPDGHADDRPEHRVFHFSGRDAAAADAMIVRLDARVEEAALDGSTCASSTVLDLLLGGDLSFEGRSELTLEGIEGAWRLYELAR